MTTQKAAFVPYCVPRVNNLLTEAVLKIKLLDSPEVGDQVLVKLVVKVIWVDLVAFNRVVLFDPQV